MQKERKEKNKANGGRKRILVRPEPIPSRSKRGPYTVTGGSRKDGEGSQGKKEFADGQGGETGRTRLSKRDLRSTMVNENGS